MFLLVYSVWNSDKLEASYQEDNEGLIYTRKQKNQRTQILQKVLTLFHSLTIKELHNSSESQLAQLQKNVNGIYLPDTADFLLKQLHC